MRIKCMLAALSLFLGLTSPCLAAEDHASALQEKMLANAGRYSELIKENGGLPVPLLSNDELVILIKPMQEKFRQAGKEYTDLEVANMLGAMALGEALRRNMAKAFNR